MDLDEAETKTKPKAEDGIIYSKIRYECKKCHEEFRNKIALTTHSYSHNRKYLENTEDFDINSSQNMKEFYITDKGGNYFKDIDEATNYSLEEIKNCYQFRRVKSFKYKIKVECDYKKRTKEDVKIAKIFFNTDYINKNAIYENGDFADWLNFEKETYEGYGYDFESLGIRSIQLNIEPTKASIGSYIDLPADLKNSKSILNIRNSKYNCLQLTVTAWLYPVILNATRESKYVDKLIEPKQQYEDDFGYILRIQKLYNINIWLYTPCGGGKVELFKPVDDFNKDRNDVRILVWGDGTTEHCALIKNIETLLDRPNRMNQKLYYCDRCTYWFDSKTKYDKHECNNSFKPEIVCPKKKHITFINEHKRQNIKNTITADIECCIVEVSTNYCKYVIAEHIPIVVGYTWQGNFKHYFGLDCIKRFARDLLEIETENNFKHNEKMIFTEEDKLYHETNNTCHICSKTCINPRSGYTDKVRDPCHETGKYRGPAFKICNLRYKQQNFIPVIFHNGSGYDFNLLYSELFKQNNDKRKVDNIPLAAGKSKMFSIGCLKFLDSYNFLAMPLDQMAKIYGCKTKTLYPYEYFGLDSWGTTTKSYKNLIGNLKIEDFKSSLHNKLPTQEEVDNFNNENSHKTGEDLTIEYLQNDVEILDYCMNEYVKLSMKEFKLNPLHYVSLPGYSFDCWLMSSGVTLDTIQDKQMLDDFVGAKRGGICGIMGDRYIDRQSRFADNSDGKTIWYIDANNLYGYAMMQKLPYRDFQFTTTTLDTILNTPDDSNHGYYIVCDIDYTNECKERTEQLALMPNKRKINDNELGYRERDGGKARSAKRLQRSEKLILDQNNKTEYMVHYRMLKFYVKMGVKVTKIHRVIKFKQDYICRDYIQNNTNQKEQQLKLKQRRM